MKRYAYKDETILWKGETANAPPSGDGWVYFDSPSDIPVNSKRVSGEWVAPASPVPPHVSASAKLSEWRSAGTLNPLAHPDFWDVLADAIGAV